MKKRPVILVTPSSHQRGAEFADTSLSISNYYALAIQAGGGLPLVVPLSLTAAEIDQCTRLVDGVVLTGGDDVQTGLYVKDLPARLKRRAGVPDPGRDWFEITLLNAVFRRRKPLLAICRGQQILNVAFGGTLWVDIATEVPGAFRHRQPQGANKPVHKLELLPHSRLAKIARGLAMAVNSCHHQAVRELARPFRATGLSLDGIIEAFELAPEEENLLPYLLAVQFHPERLYDRDDISKRIFCDFIRACGRGGEGKV
jgi:putative glutamine amidotransferase